ncbi:cytochrome P450 6B2-like [Cydia splendana]|uniref:cytochrome P450 6B2-like n=1 Tax=Cydia splendana TaxID=1100963 RepID=UPI00300C73D9
MIFLIAGVIITFLYWYSTRTFSYWKNRGVKHDSPVPGLGNNADQVFARKSMSQVIEDVYWRYPNEKIVGFYRLTQPELVIRDPDVIKSVFTTDFPYFYARSHLGSESGDQVEPLRRNMLVAEGDLWRLLRQGCSPAFTMGKLKAMFPLIVERAERLQELTLGLVERGAPIDARDLMARFTIDFIGACGLGIDAAALNDDNSPFRKLGEQIFHIGPRETIIYILKELFPGKFPFLKYFGQFEEYLLHLVREIQNMRNNTPSGRNDFVDMLMEMKRKGKIEVESMERRKPDGTPERVSMELDDMLIAANVFMFFAAGFETASNSTSFTLHALAYNPDKQKKVQQEIDRVLGKHKNKLSWDAIKEMQYLEWTFKEGLRMQPPVGHIGRTCKRKYTFQELGLTIDEGVRVRISVQALHKDPLYWDNPEEFRPERFSPDEYNEARTKYTYIPFGTGPRICAGERLGMMQSLAGLAAVLSRFTVEPAPNSKRNATIDPKSNITQGVVGGLPLIFKERKNFQTEPLLIEEFPVRAL